MDGSWGFKVFSAIVDLWIIGMLVLFVGGNLARLAGKMYQYAREGWQPKEKVETAVAEVADGR